jgi:phosphohistidine phosphatase
MKTLLLMRHAKASPTQPGVSDFDRPLLDEGIDAGERIGKFLKHEMLTVDAALSSPALRARQTIDAVLKTAGLSLNIHADQRLYEGGSGRLLEALSEVDENLHSVLLVGHNPVLEELVQLLTQETVSLSPGTLTQIDVGAIPWSEIGSTTNKLRRVVRPKELIEE